MNEQLVMRHNRIVQVELIIMYTNLDGSRHRAAPADPFVCPCS